MFKKIPVWVLCLVIFLSVQATYIFGVIVREASIGGFKIGWVSDLAVKLTSAPRLIMHHIRNKNGLIAKDKYPSISGFDGTPNSQESYLLLSRYDGNIKEGIVELVDLTNFEVLHTWNPDIDKFNSAINSIANESQGFKLLDRDQNNNRALLYHPQLTSDGGLLFNNVLRKIDACSNLIFQITHNMTHHLLETDAEGNIWTASYIYPYSLPSRKVGTDYGDFYDDAIIKLAADGEVLFEKSVAQIFIDNGLEYLIFAVGDLAFELDPIHLNDVQPVDFDGKYWKKGDVFLSMRHQSMVLLYRPSTNKIIWKGTGPFFHQHDVDILDDHRISIFDNNAKNFKHGHFTDGNNKVVIYDFEKDAYSTYLNEDLLKEQLVSESRGLHDIIANGDLFFEETNYGRTLYFNKDGSIRWRHVNRASNGKVFVVGWSRILYTKDQIKTVHSFLESKQTCN